MDRSKRLGAAVLLALAALAFWVPVHAAFPPNVGQYSTDCSTSPQIVASSLAELGAACAANRQAFIRAAQNSNDCTATASFSSDTDRFKVIYSGSSCSGDATYFVTLALTCPVNSQLVGGQCTCTAPSTQNGANNGCNVPETCLPLGTAVPGSAGNQYAGSAGYSGGLMCNGGCKVYPSSSWKAADGKWYGIGPLVSVGSTATCTTTPAPGGSDVPTTTPPPVTCDTGKCPGQVNGLNVCMPCSSGSTSSPGQTTTTTTTPDGGTGTTDTTTKSSDTTCDGANCTTTTTTVTTPGGGGTATTQAQTKVEPKETFCKENPRSPLCVVSAFSGACQTGFKGEGDALLKATAEAVNKTNCLLDAGADIDTVKAQLAAGTFGPDLSTKTVNISQFDQTNPYGSTCPPDVVVNLSTIGSFTIPLSQMCVYLQLLGYIALGVTLISSTVFVVKGFR